MRRAFAFTLVMALLGFLAWRKGAAPPKPPPSPEESAAAGSAPIPVADLPSKLPTPLASPPPEATPEPSGKGAEEEPLRRRIKSQMIVMGGIKEDVVIDYVQLRYAQLSSCAKADLRGEVTVRFFISPMGRVIKAEEELSNIDDQDLKNCVLAEVKRLVFPEPVGGGSVEVFYPFRFPLEKVPPLKASAFSD